jgi:hypothetical protein
MTIEGEKVPGFSAISLNLPPSQWDYTEQIFNHSRAQYGSSREYVERYVHERYLSDNQPKQAPAQPQKSQASQQSRPAPKPQPKPAPAAAKPAPVKAKPGEKATLHLGELATQEKPAAPKPAPAVVKPVAVPAASEPEAP